MKCQLCWREGSDGLCQYHVRAKARVESAYNLWVKAYGALDWKEYLGKVIANPETGQWSREIAQLLEGVSNDKRETSSSLR